MHRFFVSENNINVPEKSVVITGDDALHIKNVLRMKCGEEVSVMVPGSDSEYRCCIDSFSKDEVNLTLMFVKEVCAELPCEVVLYQGLPKSDKMELVITKSVELGVSRIVPVATDRAVVKLDGGRSTKKVARWNAISEAAAKQSKRAIIPKVDDVCTFSEALHDCISFDVKIIPYELADPDSMELTRKVIADIKPGSKVAIFIGPEGGFTEEEMLSAKNAGAKEITLGHRILRTETAGPVVLSWIGYTVE